MERELFASTHQAWVDTKSKFVTSKTLSSISASVSTFYLSTKSSPHGFDAELTMFIYAKGLFGDLNTDIQLLKMYLTIVLGSLFGRTSDVVAVGNVPRVLPFCSALDFEKCVGH